MIIYRPHRGMLDEAMKETREFNTEDEMKRFIVSDWNADQNGLFGYDDIVIDDKEINDDRIGWKDTRYVCVNRMGDKNYIKMYGVPQCIGMCATKYNLSRRIIDG